LPFVDLADDSLDADWRPFSRRLSGLPFPWPSSPSRPADVATCSSWRAGWRSLPRRRLFPSPLPASLDEPWRESRDPRPPCWSWRPP